MNSGTGLKSHHTCLWVFYTRIHVHMCLYTYGSVYFFNYPIKTHAYQVPV